MSSVAHGVAAVEGFGHDVWSIIPKQCNALLRNPAVRRVFVSEQEDASQSGTPLVVGENAVAAVGAAIVHDLAPYKTVLRNPARLPREVPYARH